MAPTSYQVSTTSGTGFGSSLMVAYGDGTLAATKIYVRFSPTAVQNYTGNIVNTGGGAAAESVYVSGSGAPALDVAVSGNGLPEIIQLGQNYPNPFNPNTRIPYSVNKKSWVKLTIFNILGQRIRTLIDEEQEAGYYRPEFDISRNNNGVELPSGVYFYRLEIARVSFTKKLLLLK
jgi:hypothetical protein